MTPFTLLIPNSVMAISDYQAGYEDGYTAALVSNDVYAIVDACEPNIAMACYSTEFFALYHGGSGPGPDP
jgi:hypothetical protein